MRDGIKDPKEGDIFRGVTGRSWIVVNKVTLSDVHYSVHIGERHKIAEQAISREGWDCYAPINLRPGQLPVQRGGQ